MSFKVVAQVPISSKFVWHHYQQSENHELVVDTDSVSLNTCVQQVITKIASRGICSLQLDPMSKKNSQKVARNHV